MDFYIDLNIKGPISMEERRKYHSMMKKAMVKDRWDFDEFFMYEYPNLSTEQRYSFVPEYEKNIFCDKVNNFHDSLIFESKWKSYCAFKPFYKRDCVLIKNSVIDETVMAFLSRHGRFLFKPDSAASGYGIEMIFANTAEEAKIEVKKRLAKKRRGDFVLEEVIIQHPEMAKFHPQSVNTLRIRTFRFDDRVEMLPSCMRIGIGNSVVDNLGKGGIGASIDKDGIVVVACDETGRYYQRHPDTQEQIVGAKIPYWEQVVSFAKQLAQVVPSVRYVGWDLALTESGEWVMIEGNDRAMLVGAQQPTRKGFRKQLDEIMKEIHIKL